MSSRRDFLLTVAPLGVVAVGGLVTPARAEEKKEDDEEISAPEDLMREHGVLNRILLVYEEGLRRLEAKEDVSPDVFHRPAALVRSFVEDYHERNEERFIFPRLEEKKTLVDLVTTLRQQHDAGRRVTDVVLHHADKDRFRSSASRQEVMRACESFIRMYRPHEAREDTVLFPALYKVIGAKAVKDLGEQFEEAEHRLVGAEGFEKTVDEVAAVEKQLGIYDLARFTPK